MNTTKIKTIRFIGTHKNNKNVSIYSLNLFIVINIFNSTH